MENEIIKMEWKKSRAEFDKLRKEILGKASSVMELHSMDVYYAIERCFKVQLVAHYYGLAEFEKDVLKLAGDGGIREEFLVKCMDAIMEDIIDDSIMKMLEVYEQYPHNDLDDYIYLIYMRAMDMIRNGVNKKAFRFILMSFIPYEYRAKFNRIIEKREV